MNVRCAACVASRLGRSAAGSGEAKHKFCIEQSCSRAKHRLAESQSDKSAQALGRWAVQHPGPEYVQRANGEMSQGGRVDGLHNSARERSLTTSLPVGKKHSFKRWPLPAPVRARVASQGSAWGGRFGGAWHHWNPLFAT